MDAHPQEFSVFVFFGLFYIYWKWYQTVNRDWLILKPLSQNWYSGVSGVSESRYGKDQWTSPEKTNGLCERFRDTGNYRWQLRCLKWMTTRKQVLSAKIPSNPDNKLPWWGRAKIDHLVSQGSQFRQAYFKTHITNVVSSVRPYVFQGADYESCKAPSPLSLI